MQRRTCLKTLAGAWAVPAPSAVPNPIQLHVDLNVDPSRERALAANYRNVFVPTIRKQPGFVSVRLLKMRGAVAGTAPRNISHRLVISFQTEEQRRKWVASGDHQRAWPAIEKNLKDPNVVAVLYDTL